MFIQSYKLLSNSIGRCHLSKNFVCTSPAKFQALFKTAENSPSKHTTNDLSFFYTVPNEVKKRLFRFGGLPRKFEEQCKTFTETCIMVREPALDIITCLKCIDFNRPPVKFVLHGKQGTGKSLSLAHVMHYGMENNFLIVHVPWVGNWMRRCKESCNSTTREGYVDMPIDAAAWLGHFKNQNSALLSNPELKVSQDYVWSKRETTPKGAHIVELIDHGIDRIKFASDCVVVLLNEIKQLAVEGKLKCLVAIDGFNAFFHPDIRVHYENKVPVLPGKVTLTEGFLNITKFDWKNGAIVLTVDEIAASKNSQESHLPKYLLGKEGFNHLDPFIPIPVEDYNDKELHNTLEYFKERKWIQELPGYDKELKFLSGSNPYKLMGLCASV